VIRGVFLFHCEPHLHDLGKSAFYAGFLVVWRSGHPEIDHLPPRDFAMTGRDFIGNVVRRFADDRQIVDYCVYDFFVVFKRIKINP
jgi:hypothetical protein